MLIHIPFRNRQGGKLNVRVQGEGRFGTTEKGSGARIEDLIALVENKLDSDVSLGDKGKYSFGDDRDWETNI